MSTPHLSSHIGTYTHYTHCRFCQSNKLTEVVDLGLMPLAGGFLKNQKEIKDEKLFPLTLAFCTKCQLLQVPNVIKADTLFKEYFYESSAIGTLVSHFKEIAEHTANKYKTRDATPFFVEIGANDGAFIQALIAQGFNAVGVDPAENIVKKAQSKKIPIELGYFTEKMARHLVKSYGQADAIFSFNTLAHIEDLHEVMRGITLLLKPTGYLQFEIHYLGSILEHTQYDMIYHEHQYYYSLLTLKKFFRRYGMSIFSIKKTSTHAGSLSVSVQFSKSGIHKIQKNVKKLLEEEQAKKYHLVSTYKKLGVAIEQTKIDLLNLLNRLKSKGKTIAGYGASGRGTIISNYCKLDSSLLTYVIDDAPAKKNVLTPGVHLSVYPSTILDEENSPDYVLLFAWSFLKEIKTRTKKFSGKGGRYILPLPKVTVIK